MNAAQIDPAATPTESAELQQLTLALRERLKSSGQWDELMRKLRKDLDKSDWEEDLRNHARGAWSLIQVCMQGAMPPLQTDLTIYRSSQCTKIKLENTMAKCTCKRWPT